MCSMAARRSHGAKRVRHEPGTDHVALLLPVTSGPVAPPAFPGKVIRGVKFESNIWKMNSVNNAASRLVEK